MSKGKVWTGERLETSIFNDNTIEHLHRYAIALDFVKAKRVLDIASGEGYGSELLSKYAKSVLGVDIDETSVINAKNKYKFRNLEFQVGQADLIPLEDNAVDVVVSFETLEHHDKHQEMMKEIKRVLTIDGILIISTPDKKYYTDNKNSKNQFHIKELYSQEFKNLINEHFLNSQFYSQNIFKGSLIVPEENGSGFKCFSGDFESINNKHEWAPPYLIAIASDKILPSHTKISGFDGESILRKGQEEFINNLYQEIELAKLKTREDAVNWVRKSMPFRIGNAILSPFRIFKR